MQPTGTWGGFYKFGQWIIRLIWLNTLIIVFTLMGLILFGIMPTTIAAFATVRKWIQKNTEVPLFQTFFYYYKKNFITGNILFAVLFNSGFILSIVIKY